MKRERRAVRRVGDELVPLDYAVRTVKGHDRMCAGSGGRRCGLRDAGMSALAYKTELERRASNRGRQGAHRNDRRP